MTTPPLSYATPDRATGIRTRVNILAVLILISTGLNLLNSLGQIGFMAIIFAAPMTAATTPAAGISSYQRLLMILIYGIPFLLSAIAAPFQIIGGMKLLGRKRRARQWGIAASIICMASVWGIIGMCCLTVLLSIGVGIYGIVLLNLSDVKQYLERPVSTGFEPQIGATE